MTVLILASTSPYRRELLQRLQISFEVVAPNVDETPLDGEIPAALAQRLAQAKARAAVPPGREAIIIGSDQVAHVGSERFGKPGTRDAAIAQLRKMSGREIIFDTALCVLNCRSGRMQMAVVPTIVGFRRLSDPEIARYLDKEDALACAGSAKSEGLGISLLRYMRGDDPNALIGLPLIALSEMLRTEGFNLP